MWTTRLYLCLIIFNFGWSTHVRKMIALICQHLAMYCQLGGSPFSFISSSDSMFCLDVIANPWDVSRSLWNDFCLFWGVFVYKSSKTWLYWSTRPSRGDAGSLNNSDFKMSLSNLSCKMFFNLRYVNWAFAIGGFVVFIEQCTAKWSDIRSATCTLLTMVAGLHIIKSMMLPFMCVGSATRWCILGTPYFVIIRGPCYIYISCNENRVVWHSHVAEKINKYFKLWDSGRIMEEFMSKPVASNI